MDKHDTPAAPAVTTPPDTAPADVDARLEELAEQISLQGIVSKETALSRLRDAVGRDRSPIPPPTNLDVAWQYLCYPPRGFTPPADITKMQREIAALFEASKKFALKSRALGQSEARKLASLFAELEESTAKPAKQKRGKLAGRLALALDEAHAGEGLTHTVRTLLEDCAAALAKRGKWRKRAERWKECCKGLGDELSKAHDWIDSLEAKLEAAEQRIAELSGPPLPDPPPAAPATDPAGYREGQVVEHVKGGMYRCTRPVDAVDGQVMCYSLADGFQLWFPADMLRPIPPHPGCVVLASIATQREYYVVNSIDTDGTILCDGDFRFAPGNFTVMAPAPGWQQEVE